MFSDSFFGSVVDVSRYLFYFEGTYGSFSLLPGLLFGGFEDPGREVGPGLFRGVSVDELSSGLVFPHTDWSLEHQSWPQPLTYLTLG